MLIEMYGVYAIKKTLILKWTKYFSEEREDGINDKTSGWPLMSRTDEKHVKIHKGMHENH